MAKKQDDDPLPALSVPRWLQAEIVGDDPIVFTPEQWKWFRQQLIESGNSWREWYRQGIVDGAHGLLRKWILEDQREQQEAHLLPKDKEWVNPKEAAAMLGMKRSKIYYKLTGDNFHPERTDGLWSFKDGGQRKILVADVEAYAKRKAGSNE